MFLLSVPRLLFIPLLMLLGFASLALEWFPLSCEAAANATSSTVAGTRNAGTPFSDKPEYLVLPQKGKGAPIECAVYRPRVTARGAKTGLVVHLYGASGSAHIYNMMRPPYAMVRRLLWERGYWLVVPDLGGAHWMNEAASRSVDAVIDDMIRDHGVDPKRVHILGTSMGAGSGLIYVMQNPKRVQSICAVFPMTDFTKWVQERPAYLTGIANAYGVKPAEAAEILKDMSPIEHVAAFANTPVFLLHGDGDSIVPTHHSREFAAALKKQGAPVTYREAHGFGHNDNIAEAFQKEIVDFLTGSGGKHKRK